MGSLGQQYHQHPRLTRNANSWASKLVQQVRTLTAKSEDLALISSRLRVAEGGTDSCKLSSDILMCALACAYPKFRKKKKFKKEGEEDEERGGKEEMQTFVDLWDLKLQS